ncbi:hypothetical protein HD806DRAFT_494231 [Xylariaceae sp. AK1471]|nr:hypothetical protein HD806DRAFT_494231 [Xylariaceae sp. AK1471]
MAFTTSSTMTIVSSHSSDQALMLKNADEADRSGSCRTDSMQDTSIAYDKDAAPQLGGAYEESLSAAKNAEVIPITSESGQIVTIEGFDEERIKGSDSAANNPISLSDCQILITRVSDESFVPTLKSPATMESSYDDGKALQLHCHNKDDDSFSVTAQDTPWVSAQWDLVNQDSPGQHGNSIIGGDGSEPSSESSGSRSSSPETLVDEEEHSTIIRDCSETSFQSNSTESTSQDLYVAIASSSTCSTEEEDICMAIADNTIVKPFPGGYAQPLNLPDATAKQTIANETTETDSTEVTPSPYNVGQVLDLKVFSGRDLLVTITRVYSLTMSPVMAVQFDTESGPQEAVLKLYDRRFGEHRIPFKSWEDIPEPHTSQAEAAWERYVREGLAEQLCKRMKRREEMLKRGESPPGDDPEDKKPEWEIIGDEEGRFYFYLQRDYTTEVEVYEELKDLQGKCIPTFLSSVVFDMPSAPPDLPAKYFQVPGILIEKLDGFSLTDLIDEMPEADPLLWQEIIQLGVDGAAAINLKGVLNLDCCPRNAVVCCSGEEVPRVYLVDFAKASLKSEYREHCHWKRSGMVYDWKICDCWRCNFKSYDNTGAIGSVMVMKAIEATGEKLNINYPEERVKVLKNGKTEVLDGDFL